MFEHPYSDLREDLKTPCQARLFTVPVPCDKALNWRVDLCVDGRIYFGQKLFPLEKQAVDEAWDFCRLNSVEIK
jgi:hypothetical protein